MKILLNNKLSLLCGAFHRGDITLIDYREQRRRILEQLGYEPEESAVTTSPVFKHVVTGTLVIVLLLVVTVILVRYLL